MEALQASALPLGYATVGRQPSYTFSFEFSSNVFELQLYLLIKMIHAVQAEGMGGTTLAYPLDAPSAYHQPAIRTALSSRFDLQGGSKNVSGFGLNESFCSWLAGGASVFEKGFDVGLAFAFRNQSVGFSVGNNHFVPGWWGEWSWWGSWGVTYEKGLNLGIALHPHPTLTLATEKNKVGIEWRLFSCLALRTGYKINNNFTWGATYYRNYNKEFSFFANTAQQWGLALALKW